MLLKGDARLLFIWPIIQYFMRGQSTLKSIGIVKKKILKEVMQTADVNSNEQLPELLEGYSCIGGVFM